MLNNPISGLPFERHQLDLSEQFDLVWKAVHSRNSVQKGRWIALLEVRLLPTPLCPNRLYILKPPQITSCYILVMQYGIQCHPQTTTAGCSATVLFNKLTQTLVQSSRDLRQEVHVAPRRDTDREPSLDLICRHSQKTQTKPLPRKPNTKWGKNSYDAEKRELSRA